MEPSPSLPRGSGPAPPAGSPEPGRAPAPARAVPPRTGGGGPGWASVSTRAAVITGAIALVLVVAAAVFAGTGYRYESYSEQPLTIADQIPSDDRGLQLSTARLRGRQRDLSARLAALAPHGVYIVIDQTQNRLYLKRADDTLLQAVVSTGSGMVLRESGGKKREWVFDSPRGRFEVRLMTRNPVWAKPDWAFVEDSQPIPKNPADRLDYGSLGEYALHFGDGFMIHGTLYERLLGRAVSHGCVRVGRDDLRKVWANSKLGTYIYIY